MEITVSPATTETPVVLTLNKNPVLGGFEKAIPGSVSVNFGLSGGKHCDPSCRHHPESTDPDPTRACYAVRVELRGDRRDLYTKLARHEAAGPEAVMQRANDEICRKIALGARIPWVRISTNGSLPNPADASPAFLESLRGFLKVCKAQAIPVHIPVETASKTLFYKKAIRGLATVRQSAQSLQQFLDCKNPTAFTVGTREQTRIERVESAKQVAKLRTEMSGRRTVVCPAVASRYLNNNVPNPKAKCGNCRACSEQNTDVIYPLH